jgi:ADP-heptose:LPS heptosyltransferase
LASSSKGRQIPVAIGNWVRYYYEIFRIGISKRKVNPGTLLIVRLDAIGDYVLFRNFLETIRKSDQYKSHRITLCGNSIWKDLAIGLDQQFVDEFIWVDPKELKTQASRITLARKLRYMNFETVINPVYSRDADVEQLVVCSGAINIIGQTGEQVNISSSIRSIANKYYTHLIPSSREYQFEFYRNREFFENLLNRKISLKRPFINTENGTEEYITLCPGAGDPARRWNVNSFDKLCRLLLDILPQCKPVICGSKQDAHLADQLKKNPGVEYMDLTGQLSLMQLTEIFSKSAIIIANDSGPFHIAAALNKPAVCISNGNNYGRFAPYPPEMNTRSHTVFPPALLRETNEEIRIRKYGKAHQLLDINSVSVEDVFREARSLIKNHTA